MNLTSSAFQLRAQAVMTGVYSLNPDVPFCAGAWRLSGAAATTNRTWIITITN
jgi:hypothetical protein